MLKELVKQNRSYRRFFEDKSISEEQLLEFIDNARLTPSAANKQPIRYCYSCDAVRNAAIFPHLHWAAYLQDWDGPAPGERPAGYIILLAPKGVNAACDEGIIAQTILLSAAEKGMGGCMIANIDRTSLSDTLHIPDPYQIQLVIALGYPRETVVIDDISAGDDIRYYRDECRTHHVPKLRLKDVILN